MKIFSFLVLVFAGLALGCAAKQGEPMDISKVCDVANDGKYLEVKGVIASPTSMFCSNIASSRVNCPFDVLASVGGEKKFRIDVEQGGGANTLDKVPSGYKKEDIKVRDNAGNQVALDNDLVKLTGKFMVSPDAKVCLMTVDRIEK
jgi:hypothetical protein